MANSFYNGEKTGCLRRCHGDRLYDRSTGPLWHISRHSVRGSTRKDYGVYKIGTTKYLNSRAFYCIHEKSEVQ